MEYSHAMKASLLVVLLPTVAAAQPRPGAILDDLAATRSFEEIAITPDGQLAWSFNTPGMFRARMREGGKMEIGVYRDEP